MASRRCIHSLSLVSHLLKQGEVMEGFVSASALIPCPKQNEILNAESSPDRNVQPKCSGEVWQGLELACLQDYFSSGALRVGQLLFQGSVFKLEP